MKQAIFGIILTVAIGATLSESVTFKQSIYLKDVDSTLTKLESLAIGYVPEEPLGEMLDIDTIFNSYKLLFSVKESHLGELKKVPRIYAFRQALDKLIGGAKTHDDVVNVLDRKQFLEKLVDEYKIERKRLIGGNDNMAALEGTKMGALIETLLCPNSAISVPYSQSLGADAYEEHFIKMKTPLNKDLGQLEGYEFVEKRAEYYGAVPMRILDSKEFKGAMLYKSYDKFPSLFREFALKQKQFKMKCD